MKIIFDPQIFSLQEFGGISRYYSELINNINHTDNKAYLPILFSNNTYLHDSNIKVDTFLPSIESVAKKHILQKLNQINLNLQLKRLKFDIFHATYYNTNFIKHLRGRPFVITFFDMIHEKFAHNYPGLDDFGQVRRQKKILADRANCIIAISENTKRDIIELLDIDPAKVEVIYLGSSLEQLDVQQFSKSKVDPYLLFVGRRERYKNFNGLIQAIHPILRKHKLKLICAGGGSFSPVERKLILSLGLQALVEQVSITDTTLKLLYQQAIAFIFPTLYEGFGIPVLEAFACDCPCIVSNLSSLPEVAGDAALYIDPVSPASIVDAVEQIIYDTQLRNSLIERGRKRLTRFSWDRTTSETIQLYDSLV